MCEAEDQYCLVAGFIVNTRFLITATNFFCSLKCEEVVSKIGDDASRSLSVITDNSSLLLQNA